MLLSVLGQVSTSIYTPFFHELAARYNTPVSLIEKSVALFLIAFSLSQLVAGIMCDYLDKMRLLQLGLLTFIAGTAIIAFAESDAAFLAGRVIQGIGGGAGVSVTRALSRQLFTPTQLNTALSLTNIAFGVAPAIAPLLGTLIGQWFGIPAIFYAVVALAVVTLTLLMLLNLSTHHQTQVNPDKVMRATLTLLRAIFRPLLLIGIASGLLYGIVFSFVTMAPSIIIGQYHYSKTAFSLFSLLATLFFVLGSLTNIRLASLGLVRKFILSSQLILTLTLLLLALEAAQLLSLSGLLSLSYLIFFLIGIAMPCSVSIMLGYSDTAAGFLAAIVGFFHLTGASAGAYLVASMDFEATQSFILTIAGLSLVSVIATRLMKTE